MLRLELTPYSGKVCHRQHQTRLARLSQTPSEGGRERSEVEERWKEGLDGVHRIP